MFVNQKSIFTIRLSTDLIILNLCFLLSAIAAQSLDVLISRNYMFILLLLVNIFWKPLADFYKLYDEIISHDPIAFIFNALKSSVSIAIISVIFVFLFKEDLFTRYFIILFSISLFAALVLKHIILRKTLKRLRRKGISVKNLVIVGVNDSADDIAHMVKENPQLGFNLIGMIGTENDDGTLGNYSQIENIITEKKIEAVFLVLPTTETELINNIIRITDRLAISNYIIPDYTKFISNKYELKFLGDHPIISVRKNVLEEFQSRLVKRTFDIVISFILLISVVWWLFPILIILIKINSKGPAFFIQKRNGYKNKAFNCYKFRTMTTEASSEVNSSKPISKNDIRVTKIGRFLRKTNFDETPQILNVIKGNMSVVGPRPHSLAFDENYTEMVEELKLRYRVHPGITGWAQIHGYRGDALDFEENRMRTKKRIEHDIWYIENWSLALDLKICLSTLMQLIRRKNPGV